VPKRRRRLEPLCHVRRGFTASREQYHGAQAAGRSAPHRWGRAIAWPHLSRVLAVAPRPRSSVPPESVAEMVSGLPRYRVLAEVNRRSAKGHASHTAALLCTHSARPLAGVKACLPRPCSLYLKTALAQRRLDLLEYRVEHRDGQATGLGILAAGVVSGDEGVRAGGVLRAVGKLWTRSRQGDAHLA
jgi:hypothetical protein